MSVELSIVLLIALVIECITLQIYVFNSFEINESSVKFSISSILTFLILYFISLINNFILNTVFFTVATFCLLYIFTPLGPLFAFFHSLLISSAMTMTEFITFQLFNKYTSDFYNKDLFIVNGIGVMIISKLLFFFLMLIISVFNHNKYNSPNITYNLPIFLLVIPIISISAVLGLSFLWLGNFSYIANIQVDLLIPIITFLIVALNVLVFVNEYQRRKKYIETTELQLRLQNENNLSNYYQSLLKEYEDRAILIHDIKNHLQSIRELNKNNADVDGYIEDLLASSALKSSVLRSDNDMLNAIVTRYYEKSLAENISFNTDIRRNVIDFMQNEDITSLFCNLLDNAFEACVKSDSPAVELHIDVQPGSECTIIKLSNSCPTNPLPKGMPNRSDALIPTSKADKRHHGLGMKSIHAIVEKYSGSMIYSYNEERKTFTVSILVMAQTSSAS